jgi:hypothetical protein
LNSFVRLRVSRILSPSIAPPLIGHPKTFEADVVDFA